MNEPLNGRAEVKTRWGVVALAVAVGGIGALQVGKVPPAIPTIRADLAIGLVTAGWVASIFNAIGATFGVAAGIVTDRLGHRRIAVAGLVLLAAGSLLGGFAGSGAGLLAARLLEGFGFVVIVVAAPSIIVAAAAPRHHRLALGLWSCYMPIGMALIMLASPPLLAALGWRGLWLANAALIAAFALAFAVASRGVGARPARRQSWADVGQALSRAGPWLLAACFACYTVQWFGLLIWLPTFLVEALGRSPAQAAVLSGLVVAVNVAGNLLGGWLLHRGARRWRLLAIVSGCLGLLALGVFSPAVPGAAKIAMAFGFSLIGGILPASALAGVPLHSPSPGQIGAVNGILVQGANIGTVAGPPVVAVLVTGFGGWGEVGWVLGLFGVVGILLAVLLGAVERRL